MFTKYVFVRLANLCCYLSSVHSMVHIKTIAILLTMNLIMKGQYIDLCDTFLLDEHKSLLIRVFIEYINSKISF